MREIFKLTCSALPDATRVAGFRGVESISRPYAFELYLHLDAQGQDLDLADAVGVRATLEMDRVDGRPPFVFHGMFALFELLHEFGERTLLHATLVPQVWQLTQTLHSRIFTKKSIPDIIQSVLEDAGLGSSDFTFKLAQRYPVEEHVCQYRESDFDFISRWMEREGMYYYFEQGDSSEKLIIADSKVFAGPFGDKAVRFFAAGGGSDESSGEALHTFTCKHHALPATVSLKDYDYTKPALEVAGSAPVSKAGLGEISVYGARFFSPDDGKRLAKIRAEEILARQVIFYGTGTAFYLRPGYLFTVEDHPRAAFNAKYLATQVEHTGNQSISNSQMRELTGIDLDGVYQVEVTAIPAKVQFRAESTTAWPRIYGSEDGMVCGPAESDYAQIDEHGRYNVKFKFDESDLKNGKASTFVRMMQPHGGDIEGFHFPLRKGTEVIFTFLGGDPDRPVISGVVPNAHTPSPVTSANHTKNVIQTGGRNRLEIEDKKGQERITLSTPYSNTYLRMGCPIGNDELTLHTDDNTWFDSGHNMRLDVGIDGGSGYFQIQVKDDYETFVKSGLYQLVVESKTWLTKVKGDSEFHTTNGHWHQFVDAGEWYTKVTGGDTTLHNTDSNTTIKSDAGTMTLTSKGAMKVQSTAATIDLLSAQKAQLISSGDDVYIEGSKVTTKSRSDHHHQILGADYTEVNGTKQQLVKGDSRTITIGSAQAVFIGGKNTMNLSGELTNSLSISHTTYLGLKSDIKIAGISDISIAAKFTLELSIGFKLNGAVTLELKSAAVHAYTAKLKNSPTNISFCGFSLNA